MTVRKSVWLAAVGLCLAQAPRGSAADPAVAEPVRLAFLWRPAVRDPDDDMVLETAVNGRADAIVTFNLRDFGTAAKRFGIDTLSPGEAVRRWEIDR